MDTPPVCVLTPVYNGEAYLVECVESVLAQDYATFEYIIVNNCSTDGTLGIAESYAKKDPRVRVTTNGSFVGAIANHNAAFRLVPTHCKYCKVVSADDTIEPDCLGKMVRFAETHASVGIVGCYQRSGDSVKWTGLSRAVDMITGREAARLGLLHGVHVLGTPTSVLYRADLIRLRKDFFPHPRSYADASACYECFAIADFGFLHEVLAMERIHPEQWTTKMDALGAGSVGYLDLLLQYGPRFLTPQEFQVRKTEVFDLYYRYLGGCVWKNLGREFWRFHRSRLQELGYQLDHSRLAKEAIREAVVEARHPLTAMQKVLAAIRRA